MRLTVQPLPKHWLDLISEILREEPRPPVSLLDNTVPRTEALLTMCGWCKRVRLESNRWVEVEKAVELLRLFDRKKLPAISHGICPGCSELVTAAIEPASA